MSDTRTLLQRFVALALLAVGFGYAIAAGYWMMEESVHLAAVNLFWFALFISAALVIDGPTGLRARIWALGWTRLFGILFAFIAFCDLAVAGYWFTQRNMDWMVVNLVGVVFFGILAALCFLVAWRASSTTQ